MEPRQATRKALYSLLVKLAYTATEICGLDKQPANYCT